MRRAEEVTETTLRGPAALRAAQNAIRRAFRAEIDAVKRAQLRAEFRELSQKVGFEGPRKEKVSA